LAGGVGLGAGLLPAGAAGSSRTLAGGVGLGAARLLTKGLAGTPGADDAQPDIKRPATTITVTSRFTGKD